MIGKGKFMQPLHLPTEIAELSLSRLNELKEQYSESKELSKTFADVLGLSDFVHEYLNRQTDKPVSLVNEENKPELESNYEALLKDLLDGIDNETQLLRCIRQFRHQYMAQITYWDLTNQQTIEQSLKRVSELSNVLIMQTYDWFYQHLCNKYGQPLGMYGPMPMIILGMGKLGGQELNFSSDIDLIFLYPEQGVVEGGRKSREHSWFFNRLAQSVINALDKITADGRVFRVDMRLRPYGESGPLVMHFDAFENYLQEQGRDWERFAMVKARVLNDNSPYRDNVESLLRPFVYRKYLDFGAIEALRKMKSLITQEVRRRRLTNNIKLGAGGIREAEFIVQSLQLINGGKQVMLRVNGLINALNEIQQLSLMASQDCQKLKRSYLFLRKVEHCLQQFNDQQTQTLPDSTIDQSRLAFVMGFENYKSFLVHLEQETNYIHQLFVELIGEEQTQDVCAVESDLESLWMLSLDFDEASSILGSYLSHDEHETFWHALIDFNRESSARVHVGRGKDILDKLMPQLLSQLFAHYTDNQGVNERGNGVELNCTSLFNRICIILKSILRRTAYLELMHINPDVLRQLLRLCHASLWISEQISRFPLLLDELLNPQGLYHTLARNEYAQELRLACLRIEHDDIEQQMESLRQFKLGQQLKIAAADVTGMLPIMKVSDHLTYLAEAIVNQVVEDAWIQISDKYGFPQNVNNDNKAFAIIAYGKFGGIELGYGSDLDLVFVYQTDPNGMTDGPKPIEARTFYIKLAQRILHLFNTRTHSGHLYEVDMRLRPAGNSGLLVCHTDTYLSYLQKEAWTWEHQALVRSRIILSSQVMAETISDIRLKVLAQKRDAQQLAAEVNKMRDKMREHLSVKEPNVFDIKHGKGGLVDIEFLVQYWVLLYANQHPSVCTWSDSIRVLDSLKELALVSDVAIEHLKNAYLTYRHEGHRLTLSGNKLVSTNSKLKAVQEGVSSIWQQVFSVVE
jgi:glutamate-ammonia-ligase adenylyltransferase